MAYQTLHEKIAQKSRTEIERITFLLNKYSKDCRFTFIDGLSYLMGECGYRKINYNPCEKNKDDLFLITQLSIKYMKVYAVGPERFIQTVLECWDYCNKNGYSSECSQTTLKLDKQEPHQ